MFNPTSKDEQFARNPRGEHAPGELVLVQKQESVETKEEDRNNGAPHAKQQCISETLDETCMTPTSSSSLLTSSPGHDRRKTTIKRQWVGERKAAAASLTIDHNPSAAVAVKPELDDVEGLLFASFGSKVGLNFFTLSNSTDLLDKESGFKTIRQNMSMLLDNQLLWLTCSSVSVFCLKLPDDTDFVCVCVS